MNEELNEKMLDWFANFYKSGIIINFGFIKDKNKQEIAEDLFNELTGTCGVIKRLREIDKEAQQKEINQTMKKFDDVVEKIKKK